MNTRIAGWFVVCLLASGGCFLKGAENQVPQRGGDRCAALPESDAPEDFLARARRDDGYCRFAEQPDGATPSEATSAVSAYRPLE